MMEMVEIMEIMEDTQGTCESSVSSMSSMSSGHLGTPVGDPTPSLPKCQLTKLGCQYRLWSSM